MIEKLNLDSEELNLTLQQLEMDCLPSRRPQTNHHGQPVHFCIARGKGIVVLFGYALSYSDYKICYSRFLCPDQL